MIKLKTKFNALLVGVFMASMIATFFHHKTAAQNTYETFQTANTGHEIKPQVKPVAIKKTRAQKINTEPSETSNSKPIKAAADCTADCQNRILKILSKGGNLTPIDANIIVQNADVFAPLLAATPNSLAKLLIRLQQDEGENDHEQFAAYAILETLSDEENAAAGQTLLSHKNAAFRMLGIKLSEESITQNAQAAQALNKLIETDKNSRVLVAALEVLTQEKTPGPFASETVAGLNHLIGFHKSDHIRGSALVAKSKVVRSTKDSKTDILSALSSASPQLQAFGLQAFSVARTRHGFQPDSASQWTNDEESIKLLQNIINNKELDDELRQLAGELTLID